MTTEENIPGTLNEGEFHPAAQDAFNWISEHSLQDLSVWLESFSSVALSGNRTAEICAETLNRFMNGKPLSDRYLLGLAWTLRQMAPCEHDRIGRVD